jgi:hypothetical protein
MGRAWVDQVQWALGMDEADLLKFGPAAKNMNRQPILKQKKQRGDKICSVPKVFWKYPGDIVMERVKHRHLVRFLFAKRGL